MSRELLVLLVLLLTACAPTIPEQQFSGDCAQRVVGEPLLERHWLKGDEVWRIRQSALLEFRTRSLPLDGFLRLDLKQRMARMVAMNEIGMVLFDLQVDEQGEELKRAIPQLQKVSGLSRGIAQDLRRIFLTPQPQATDRAQSANNGQLLIRKTDSSQTSFLFDCQGDLRTTRMRGEEDWWIGYDQYRNFSAGRLPEKVILVDRQRGVRLTLWIREVKQEP